MASPISAFGRFGDDKLNRDGGMGSEKVGGGGLVDPEVEFARREYGEGDWPSEIPTGGRAGWEVFEMDDEGVVEVVYPHVR